MDRKMIAPGYLWERIRMMLIPQLEAVFKNAESLDLNAADTFKSNMFGATACFVIAGVYTSKEFSSYTEYIARNLYETSSAFGNIVTNVYLEYFDLFKKNQKQRSFIQFRKIIEQLYHERVRRLIQDDLRTLENVWRTVLSADLFDVEEYGEEEPIIVPAGQVEVVCGMCGKHLAVEKKFVGGMMPCPRCGGFF